MSISQLGRVLRLTSSDSLAFLPQRGEEFPPGESHDKILEMVSCVTLVECGKFLGCDRRRDSITSLCRFVAFRHEASNDTEPFPRDEKSIAATWLAGEDPSSNLRSDTQGLHFQLELMHCYKRITCQLNGIP
jgi:hypothetical protein